MTPSGEAGGVDPYDARAIVPETDAILEEWARCSIAAREALQHRLSVPAPGCPFDFYWPENRPQDSLEPALVVFLHGGYWRRGSAIASGFLAPHLARLGAATAIPDYPLAPGAHLREITSATADCIRWIVEEAPSLGVDGSRVAWIGHSAGAHLGAMALAESFRGGGTAPRLFLGFSGLYDIVPVNRGIAQEWLRLTDAEAEELSPTSLPLGRETEIVLATGELESAGFHAQTDLYLNHVRREGCTARAERLPGRNHFDVIQCLFDSGHSLARALVAAVEFCRKRKGET